MKYAKTLKENLQLVKEAWMPDSETISWLKDYLRDVKRGEGYVDIDKVVYDADIELNKDFSKNKKDLGDYIKRIGGASILKEDQQVVIHTRNGKVDYIGKGEFLDVPGKGKTFVKHAGTNFKDFAGMDPQEAKNSLVKFSRFDPKSIIIEGCGKIEEGFDVKDGGNGKVYHTAETQSDAEAWAKDNVNKLHRPLKVVSGYKMYKSFEPHTIVKESSAKKIEEADVPTSKRELYSKAKIGFNGLKKRLDEILSLVEKGEYKFVSSFLDDVATSCQRMAKAYDDADRMDKAGKMTD